MALTVMQWGCVCRPREEVRLRFGLGVDRDAVGLGDVCAAREEVPIVGMQRLRDGARRCDDRGLVERHVVSAWVG